MSKALIFEDENLIRYELEKLVAEIGFECIPDEASFARSEDVLTKLSNNQWANSFELALLDIVDDFDKANGKNAGIRIAQKLRQLNPSIPIVFYTANADRYPDIQGAFPEEVVGVVAKNFGDNGGLTGRNLEVLKRAIFGQVPNLPKKVGVLTWPKIMQFAVPQSDDVVIRIEQLAYLKSIPQQNQRELCFADNEGKIHVIQVGNANITQVGQYIKEQLGDNNNFYAPPRTGLIINPYHIRYLSNDANVYFSTDANGAPQTRLQLRANHMLEIQKRLTRF